MKKIISLIFGVFILLLFYISVFYMTQPLFGGQRSSLGNAVFISVILSSIFSIIGFELIRIGLKKD